MAESRIHEVTFHYNGEKIVFALKDLPRFEYLIAHLGGVFALYRKIAAGEWTTQMLGAVLGWGYNGGFAHTLPASFWDLLERYPGYFAPLTARVLEAGLFGVRPEEATMSFALDEEAA